MREHDVVRPFDADVDHAHAILDQPVDGACNRGGWCDQTIVCIDAEHISDREVRTAARHDLRNERAVSARGVTTVRETFRLHDRACEHRPRNVGASVDHADMTSVGDGSRRWLCVSLRSRRGDVIARRAEEMMGRNARQRRERLQFRDDLFDRTSRPHLDARERFVERSERTLGDDRKPCGTNGVDRSAVRDHQHFAAHTLATCAVAFDFEARGRSSAAVIVAAAAIIVPIVGAGALAARAGVVRFHRTAAGVVRASFAIATLVLLANAAVFAHLAIARLILFVRPRRRGEQRQRKQQHGRENLA